MPHEIKRMPASEFYSLIELENDIYFGKKALGKKK